MSKINPLDIYKLLNKSNCKDCGRPSCMAFALSVASGDIRIGECPHLERDIAEQLAMTMDKASREEGMKAPINALREKVAGLDFQGIARKLGAGVSGGKLLVNCLGRDFLVDDKGRIESECHVNAWVEGMLLHYCTTAGEGRHGGKWVPMEELRGGKTTAPYFSRRCEEPLKAIADSHTGIFFDLLVMFGGRRVDGFSADHALVIHPLPRVPFLILYSRPEEAFESKLKVMLDSGADTYLPTEVISAVGRGIVEMFQKIISKHQECSPDTLFL
jgi:hypothetical protein